MRSFFKCCVKSKKNLDKSDESPSSKNYLVRDDITMNIDIKLLKTEHTLSDEEELKPPHNSPMLNFTSAVNEPLISASSSRNLESGRSMFDSSSDERESSAIQASRSKSILEILRENKETSNHHLIWSPEKRSAQTLAVKLKKLSRSFSAPNLR